MKANQIRQTVFPLLTAFIWGTSFVAQSVSTDHIGPFTFNAARSIVAFLSLLALTFLCARFGSGISKELWKYHLRPDGNCSWEGFAAVLR